MKNLKETLKKYSENLIPYSRKVLMATAINDRG